ncbi:hypothetical protein HMPREF9548_04769, partial [Escherichia coli MS 182-1]
ARSGERTEAGFFFFIKKKFFFFILPPPAISGGFFLYLHQTKKDTSIQEYSWDNVL